MVEGGEALRVVAQASFPELQGGRSSRAEAGLSVYGMVKPAGRAVRMNAVEVESVSSVADLVAASVSGRWHFDRRGNETEGKKISDLSGYKSRRSRAD